jgi:Uma2 family endonuclease
MFSITFQPLQRMSPADLLTFSQLNRDLHCEMNANGSVTLRTAARPRYSGAAQNLAMALDKWNTFNGDDEGVVVGSRTGFVLKNGAIRHPSVAWVKSFKMAARTEHLIEGVPDFLVEFLTSSDNIAQAKARLKEYIQNGAKLAWLVDLDTETIWLMGENWEESVDNFQGNITGGSLLRGFNFELRHFLKGY